MKLIYPILALLCFSHLLYSQATDNPAAPFAPNSNQVNAQKNNELILQLRPGAQVAELLRFANAACPFAKQIKLEKTLAERQRIYLLSASQIIDRQGVIDFFKNKPEIVAAQWNAAITFRDTLPNDELFSNQWSMERIGASKVWDVSTGGTSPNGHEIVVAVLDKGFEITHPDLVENAWQNPAETPNDGIDNDGNGFTDDVYGWNFRGNSPIFSVERHGTAVSGIIGGNGNNNIGVAGINWNVKVMYLAIEYVDEVIAAFSYALDMRELFNASNGQQGAYIVVTNGSFGIDGVQCTEQPIWGSMYDLLGEAGVLNVAATANGDWDVDQVGDIPTSCSSEYLIAVTNTDENDQRASGAAFGKTTIDLGAPGQSITTLSTNAGFRQDFSGTSAACPHVAGAIALLYSMPCTELDSLAFAAPADCARLMRDAILKNTDAVPSMLNETVSGGRLNVYEAMKYLHSYCISRESERKTVNFKELYVGKKGLIRVFPSPTSELINIDYGNVDFKDVRVRVYNMLGQEMIFNQIGISEPFQPQTISIDVSDWSSGVYVINMFDLNKKISVEFLKI